MDQHASPDKPNSAQSNNQPAHLPQSTDPNAHPPGAPHDQFDLKEMNAARTLTTVATIGGPVSLIIGGVALSAVALVCAIIALSKVRRILARPDSAYRDYATMVRQAALMGIVVSAIALVLNLIGLIAMIPIIMEIMQTGDYSVLFGEGAENLSGSIPAPSDGNANPWG